MAAILPYPFYTEENCFGPITLDAAQIVTERGMRISFPKDEPD